MTYPPAPTGSDAARETLGKAVPPLLARLTTLGVGGPAPRVDDAHSAADVAELVRGGDVLILGGGSNLVVSDAGIDVPVVRIAIPGITIEPGIAMEPSHSAVAGDESRALVTIGAGEVWDDVVSQLVDAGWCGVETLSGIPGYAGATPIQNVGAYGTETSDVLVDCDVVDRTTFELATIAARDLELGYRTSKLRVREPISGGRGVVTQVRLALTSTPQPVKYPELARLLRVAVGDTVPPGPVREAVLALRRSKGMVFDPTDPDSRSAGSFFVNPIIDADERDRVMKRIADRLGSDIHVPHYPALTTDGAPATKLSAAWLIERAGFPRGYPRVAGRERDSRPEATVTISTKHTLALTNRGRGTAAEVVSLAREIRDGVYDAYGVTLHPEPILLGLTL